MRFSLAVALFAAPVLLQAQTAVSANPATPSTPANGSGGGGRDALPALPAVTAARAPSEVSVDGRLDEPAWAAARPMTGFLQIDPDEGQPATEQTEVRVVVSPVPYSTVARATYQGGWRTNYQPA